MSQPLGLSLSRNLPIIRAKPRISTLSYHRRPHPFQASSHDAARPRSFTLSSRFLDDDGRKGAKNIHKEEKEREREKEMERVPAAKGVQKMVNDRPWHRHGSGAQPDSSTADHFDGDDSKGRLLTTPTRLLKLILPMPFHPEQELINEPEEDKKGRHDRKVEPLALLVHPHQPLSYLERLIQAEIPPLEVKGREKLPDIAFRAEADRQQTSEKSDNQRSNVSSYSGLGREGPSKEGDEANWVRWSGSTEVGDFIRDAARGREFAINIEGYPHELRVAVPSFKDRTHYMRIQLRRMSRQIESMSQIKSECDNLAHKGAHMLAKGGFAALASWWGVVYYVTFHTEFGWDLVEPITYLAGLTTIMGGYLWFLFISRDLSYKAAMNLTVSKRQNALYQDRGFDLQKWEHLVHEANTLRREVKVVAAEYDVDWDEIKDLGGEEVMEALERERNGKRDKEDEDEDDSQGDESNDKKDEQKERKSG